MGKINLDSVRNEKFIYLTTVGRRTGRSYTKELWFALSDGKIYLSHEGEQTDWMKNIAKDKRVKARIGSITFDASARIAAEGDQAREVGKKSLYEKYYGPATKEIIDDWFELSAVVELVPV